MARWCALLGLLAVCALASLTSTHAALATSMRVKVAGSQITVDGQPYFIKGVIYSPSPIGSHPQWTWPFGDFFIPQYADLWARDFPLLRALGANTLRISGWNNELDHGYFLDQAHKAGLKVIVTFEMGNAWNHPVAAEWQRQDHLGRFTQQFQKYLGHPALLAWSFGEQLNLPANGFLQSFSDAFQCGWNGGDYNANPGGCFNNPDTSSVACAGPTACVYEHFFQFLDTAGAYAKNVMGETHAHAHLIMASISDVDLAWRRTQQFNYAAPNVDAWGLQIYRGKDFGVGEEDFLTNYERATPNNARGVLIGPPKPLIVVEYGIDAYHDPCGQGAQTPCYNDVLESPHGGSGEDEDAQAKWGASLAAILTEHSSAVGAGAVAGGTINSFIDEAWRCTSGVVGCGGPIPYPLPGFDEAQCGWKAHVQCPQMNLWRRSLCGYWTPAMPDKYANVGWFGMLRPSPHAGDLDRLTPRLLYGRLQEQWSGVNRSWSWLMVLVAALAIATAWTYHMHTEYLRRSGQVRELELRSSVMSSAQRSAGRSPLGVTSSPKPERRLSSSSSRPPAGPSSRATIHTHTAGGTTMPARTLDAPISPLLAAVNSASPLLHAQSPQM